MSKGPPEGVHTCRFLLNAPFARATGRDVWHAAVKSVVLEFTNAWSNALTPWALMHMHALYQRQPALPPEAATGPCGSCTHAP